MISPSICQSKALVTLAMTCFLHAGCLLQLLVVVQPSSIELSVLLLSRFGVVKVELVLYVDITKPAHLPLQLATVQFEDAVVES